MHPLYLCSNKSQFVSCVSGQSIRFIPCKSYISFVFYYKETGFLGVHENENMHFFLYLLNKPHVIPLTKSDG